MGCIGEQYKVIGAIGATGATGAMGAVRCPGAEVHGCGAQVHRGAVTSGFPAQIGRQPGDGDRRSFHEIESAGSLAFREVIGINRLGEPVFNLSQRPGRDVKEAGEFGV